MTIRAAMIKDAAMALANVAASMNPGVAVAMTGVQTLTELWQAKKALDEQFKKIAEETEASAPEVAQAVSAYYTTQGDALEAEFRARPGK